MTGAVWQGAVLRAFAWVSRGLRSPARDMLLTDLSSRDRRFVDLYYRQGLEPDEVAAAMRISVKTVYSKKNKMRMKLEALVSSDPDAPGSEGRSLS